MKLLNKVKKLLNAVNDKQRDAIADILEKMGTAFLIGVTISGFITDKAKGSTLEIATISISAVIFLVASVLMRKEEEDK